MTPDLLTAALTGHAADVDARPTLAADARRGARRRQLRRQSCLGLAAVAVAASVLALGPIESGTRSRERVEPAASGLQEMPFEDGRFIAGRYRLEAPPPGLTPGLSLSEAVASQAIGPLLEGGLGGLGGLATEFADHRADGMFGLLTPAGEGFALTAPRPVWFVDVHDALPSRMVQADGSSIDSGTCDYDVVIDAQTGARLAAAARCTPEQGRLSPVAPGDPAPR